MTLLERLNPFHTRRIAISTRYSVAESVARLRADVAPYWTWGKSRHAMRGTVKPTRFELQRSVHAGPAYLIQARGRLAPGGPGTILDVTLGWGRFELLSHLWELGVVAFFLREVLTGKRPPVTTIAALLLMALFPTLWSLSSHVSRAHDDDWLVAHLCELLDGGEVPRALD